MIFEHQSKNKKALFIVSFIILGLGLFLIFYSSVIFQEGNPWPQIKGVTRLTFGNNDIVRLDPEENKYITKSGSSEPIKSFLKKRGYDFTEQLGSGYFFESPTGASAVATHRYYSRYYSLWTISENNNDLNGNLWATTTNGDGITYQYPKELLAKYISIIKWPPVVKIETGTFSCKTTPQAASGMADITSEKMVNGRIYCVNVKHEGAAGSVYSSYIYTTNYTAALNSKLVNISFTLRYPNCNNYNDEQNEICASEREAFDLDVIVDRLAQTIRPS